MKRKKIIAVAIAVALQPWYTPAFALENNDDKEECPNNISLLSKEERKKLPAICLAIQPENDNHWGWVTGGIAALVAGVAIGVDNNGGGDAHHNDGGDVTPPDDGGDVTPPDDGGDVTPPDDGGDATPPDDGGDDVTPPDDGGDVTPPDDGSDVTPPDDGGDVTPPDTRVNTYDNGVTSDHAATTVTLDELNINAAPTSATHVVLSWKKSEEGDSYILTAANGTQLIANKWRITDDNNAVFSGTTSDGRFWKYDSRGNLIIASEGTLSTDVDGATHSSERGLAIGGENETGVIISGDGTENTLSGNSTVSDGATGIIITGDNTTSTISGQSTANHATGAVISGNGTTTNISGGIDVTGGGVSLIIDGDNITVDNAGISTISGEGSTGSVIGGNNAQVINEGEMTITDGGTGGNITGNDAFVDNKGNSTVSGAGSSALNINGNNATVISEGTQHISDGATGSHINGNNTTVDMTGDITVNSGATAMIIDGDNSSINITGTSDISGQGSTGTFINGDKARINNDGELNVEDGGTGAKITGNNAVVDNTGDMTVNGPGSTALSVEGDNALIISVGDQTIGAGATGTHINGDNARIANTGDIAVDDTGSIAALIDGNNSSVTQAGDLLVTHGAMGIITYGQNNTLNNIGNATVRDENSVGFVVAGQGNTFKNKGNIHVSQNGTGTLVSGNEAQITLGGNITVDSEQDSNGVYRGATGISITGNNTTTDISGNVTLNSDFAKTSTLASDDVMTGIDITGDNNQVSLSGALNVSSHDRSDDAGGYLDSVGLNIIGDGNNVDLMGGVNLDQYDTPGVFDSSITGINIDGNSSVTLGGHSQLEIASLSGSSVRLVNVTNGGQAVLNDSSVMDIQYDIIESGYYLENAMLMASGTGSSVENQGDINVNGMITLMSSSNGASVKNSGEITATTNNNSYAMKAVFETDGKNSTAVNAAGGSITLVTGSTPTANGGLITYPIVWYRNTVYGMLAYNYASIFNEAGADISIYGAGIYGMGVSKGTALNAGNIYVDGFKQTLDEDENIIGENYWAPTELTLTSSGMVAGSTYSGSGDATVTNTGTITVHNAGFGMMAMYGGTAINQGTINLTADEGITGATNQLVGMAAFGGSTVLNDETGVINIDASYGKAFYTDSKSFVINYGTICIQDDCQDSAEYNSSDNNVSLILQDGESITAAGETLKDKSIMTSLTATDTVHVTNAGTVSGGKLIVNNYGDLVNESTGNISSKVNINTGGVYTNNGTTGAISVDGGVFNNTGNVTGKVGTTVAGSVINNSGSIASVEQWASTMNNTGVVSAWIGASGSAVLNNDVGGEVNKITFTAASTVNNAGVIKNGSVDKKGTLNNLEGGTLTLADNGLWSGTLNNWGTVNGDADIATGGNGHTLYNGTTGVINGQITTSNNNGGSKAINDGTINIDKTGSVAMSAHGSAKMVNNGTINVGSENTTQTGMIGMQLASDAKADGVIENNGTINIYANNSYAFSQLGSNGHIVNNGTVVIADGVTGSGFIKQTGKTIEGSGENGDGTEVHYVDFTAPTEPTMDDGMSTVTTGSDTSSSPATNNLSGYVVGTNANGSSGKLQVNNASMSGVGINTGFTAGTADTTVTFDNVVEGNNLTDAGAIASTSVVWNAQGSTDTDGNVDVTMTKNAYTDVATDSSVDSVAQALDAGYTNNELYTSLNVGTTAELNSALKQVSGSQATTVFREARVLSNRFNMLADAAPQVKEGLAFNVMTKGDPRAELGNDTQYDMLALRQSLDLTSSQNLTLEYGIARLDGDGSQKAGDNGLTGGYSQFFGLKHSMAFEDGLAWNNALRYDVHNLDSNRSVAYGDVSKVADSSTRQQYLEFRSEGAKTFTLDEGLSVTPYAGVKLRHTLEDGYKERSAGDFNLSMNSGSETAVDSIVGLKADYAGKNGWSANMTLEGGPNLSYSKSQRSASLQGAVGQQFGLDDGQKGGGMNGLATVGVKYSAKDASLNLDAYQWKEDGISDKGFMLNFKKTFR
ncbi:BigA/YdbA N-terminal beta-barrel domain-containing protein [Citrobacter freundii]|uniref:BigA/YdbA N-terminal beta-barrel domain-containing protein n=1 Tax=Citrobacter freundii TaxID=546 RepID=UPI00214D2D14|nr:autotransporter adhesin BigA [Citrobacter freundii]MCR3690359.1 autotransporter adhesin BigA [Citrobacter freundii]